MNTKQKEVRKDLVVSRRTDFERILKAFRCEEPDHVPVAELGIDTPIKEAFLDKPIGKIRDDVEFWCKAGYDYIYLRPNYEYSGLPPSVAAGTTIQRERTIKIEEADSSLDTWRKISTEEDMEDFPWPDPETVDYSNLEEAANYLPEGMGIISGVGGIFTRAWMLLGFNNFCLKLSEDLPFIKKMFDHIGNIQCQVLKKVVKMKKVGAFWYGDDLAYAGGLLVSPNIYRQYLFPWFEELFSIAHKADMPIAMHTDGDVHLLIDDLIKIGLNALHPIEPKAMDINELKKKYQGRLCLIGNIDMAGSLGRGTPEDVRREVRGRIKSLAPGGGYAVGSSNSVAYYIPIENYRAMLQATFDYGKYPIKI